MAKTNKQAQEPKTVETKEAPVNPINKAENMAKVFADHITTSARIRYLASRGYKRADIARSLGKRYQHVRNVLVQDAQKAETKPKS